MARPLYATLALTLALAVPSASQSAPQSDWARLLKQDARISFNPARTELAAITAIEAGGLDQGTRAAALFALGASGSKRGRALIVEALASENLQERCAAVLALGELGVGVSPLLERLRGDSAQLVAECALLALMPPMPTTRRVVEPKGTIWATAGSSEEPPQRGQGSMTWPLAGRRAPRPRFPSFWPSPAALWPAGGRPAARGMSR